MNAGLAQELSTLAYRNGAAGFGVTGAEVFTRERAALRASHETGRSGPLRFTYDDPDLATDVSLSFPWARSLVAVSYDYLPEANTPAREGAVVGRFATADQYEGLRRITGAVAEYLRHRGHRAEILSDDNRLVDRAAAVRAGVGWLGKSTMVLAPGHGPWMLLGTVVTDASIPSDSPMQRDCGTCSACIPACPTGALGEWGLDARRCLSTWLQTPGSIPQWIRPVMGRRVYGCDDCLTACPPGGRALAAAGERPRQLPFSDLLALSDHDLLDRFGVVVRAEETGSLPPAQPPRGRRQLEGAGGQGGGRGPHPPPILDDPGSCRIGRWPGDSRGGTFFETRWRPRLCRRRVTSSCSPCS